MTKTGNTEPLLDPPSLDVDPFSDENIENPYHFHQAMREMAPIVHIPKYDMYAVGRYEETRTVMSDYGRFTSEGGIGMSDIRKPGAWRTPSPITEIDPPRHTAIRAAMTKILSPIVIRQWREIFAREAEVVADRVVAKGEVDGVADVTEAYVLKVFPDVLGVDMPRENFIAIGEMNFNQIGPNNHLLAESMKRVEPIMGKYAEYFDRKSMLPGGFGEKIYQAEDAGEFAPGTAGVQVRSFLRAGVDTTIAGVGHALNMLAQNPALWQALRNDNTKSKGAFEEAIRLESPAQCMFRTTSRDTELSGYRLRGDVKVGSFLGAANRDPRKWRNPESYDIDRDVTGVHLAFGVGAHVCIGQMIARLEAESILGALARRAAVLEPAGPPTYRLVNTLRTLDRLPLRFRSA